MSTSMTIEEAAESLRKMADELEGAAKDAHDEGHADEAAAWLDWAGVVRDQLSLFVFITDTFVAGKVAGRFVRDCKPTACRRLRKRSSSCELC